MADMPSTRPRKRLALFLDGTWNQVSDNTNVWRLRSLFAPVGTDIRVEERPVQVVDPNGNGPLQGIVKIAGGGGHFLALTSGGGVLAWGHNNVGQLGNGQPTDGQVCRPQTVTGLPCSRLLSAITLSARSTGADMLSKRSATRAFPRSAA